MQFLYYYAILIAKGVISLQDFSLTHYNAEEFRYRCSDTSNFSLDISTHTHEGWEFLFVKNGSLSYTVDGMVFDIKPNTLIISRPGAVHALKPKGVIHYERYSFDVAEHILNQDLLEAIPADLHVLDVSDNGLILSLYKKIGFYLSKLEGLALKNMIRSIIDELLVNVYLVSKAPSQPMATYSNPIVTRAIIYIKNHIRQPLTVQEVSDALFITPSHLHHCFVKHLDVTPKQYIMLQKLQMCQQALINTANPTMICQHYGFKSYSTFYRNYQKFYGCRPSDDSRPTLRKIEL